MPVLPSAERKYLLKLARDSINSFLRHENFELGVPKFSSLKEKRGVFVTLTIGGELRGCIGNIEPVYPLYEAVSKNAISAGFRDFRFGPLTEEEFKRIKIEISILSVPKVVKNSELLKILDKKPGVIFHFEGFSSVFLPQVWEDLPEKEEFLENLCMKAGMAPDAWKDKRAMFEVFDVEAFGD